MNLKFWKKKEGPALQDLADGLHDLTGALQLLRAEIKLRLADHTQMITSRIDETRPAVLPPRDALPEAWAGQDFKTLRIMLAEFEGKTDAEIVAELKGREVSVPLLDALGFDAETFHEAMIIHARRGGGL